MKKKYFKTGFQFACATVLLLGFQAVTAQVELRVLEGFGGAIRDVNDSGQAVKANGIYNFTTDTETPLDEGVMELSGINNAGDLIGTLPLERNGEVLTQPGYKKNGIWTPIPFPAGANDEAGFSSGQILKTEIILQGKFLQIVATFKVFYTT